MEPWQAVKRWLNREADEAKDLVEELETAWGSDLGRKEADLQAQPEERVQSLQERIDENTSAFEELKAKITRTGPIVVDDGEQTG